VCGRLNITSDPLTEFICGLFGIDFKPHVNTDLRPSQLIATVMRDQSQVWQQDLAWGIQPIWAKQLIINAQAETVASKPTFRQAFAWHRCLVPCSGWYEWRTEGDRAKRKYQFLPAQAPGLLMAGIAYPDSQVPALVTLTTRANTLCAQYHHRMPVLILPEQADRWLLGSATDVAALLEPVGDELISVRDHG
jgi:putative SOS response-associated peptidase YedK